MKPYCAVVLRFDDFQPPSGGCVLKQQHRQHDQRRYRPAAFGRLCVETFKWEIIAICGVPAAFGRLCVETRLNWSRLWEYRQPPSGGCVLKPSCSFRPTAFNTPAAFGRLCVETAADVPGSASSSQPPSGGCVLKRLYLLVLANGENQPPSGGCVLKRKRLKTITGIGDQPPSGGCVLKLSYCRLKPIAKAPAAFGRLCVETKI